MNRSSLQLLIRLGVLGLLCVQSMACADDASDAGAAPPPDAGFGGATAGASGGSSGHIAMMSGRAGASDSGGSLGAGAGGVALVAGASSTGGAASSGAAGANIAGFAGSNAEGGTSSGGASGAPASTGGDGGSPTLGGAPSGGTSGASQGGNGGAAGVGGEEGAGAAGSTGGDGGSTSGAGGTGGAIGGASGTAGDGGAGGMDAGGAGEGGTASAPPHYEIATTATSAPADGHTGVPFTAFGTDSLGAYASDAVVVTVDPPSAGIVLPSAFNLDGANATFDFYACNAMVDPTCPTSAVLDLALASQPDVVIAASAPLPLIVPTPVGDPTPCLQGGNVIYFDGADARHR